MPDASEKSLASGVKAGELDGVFRLRAPVHLREFTEGNTDFIHDQEFLKHYNEIADITLVSPHRAYPLWKKAREANKVSGDFAQVGVYQGGMAKLIHQVKAAETPFYLFDTFEGLPKGDERYDDYPEGAFGDTSAEKVKALFAGDPKLIVTKGLFPQTGNVIPNETRFSFVYLDVDLYESNKQGLEFFYPRMSPGGVIMIDDYKQPRCRGIEASTHEFVERTRARLAETTLFQCAIRKE